MKETLIIQFIEVFLNKAAKNMLGITKLAFFYNAGQKGKQNGQQPNFIQLLKS